MVVKATTVLLAPVGKRHLSKPARIPPKRRSEGKLTEGGGDSGPGPSVSRVPVHSPLPGAMDALSTSEIRQGSVRTACLPPQAQELLGQKDSQRKEHQANGPFLGGEGEKGGASLRAQLTARVYATHQGHGHSGRTMHSLRRGRTDGTHETPGIRESGQGWGALAFTGVLSRSPSTAGVRNPSTCGSGLPPCPKPTKSWFGTDKLVTDAATEPQA